MPVYANTKFSKCKKATHNTNLPVFGHMLWSISLTLEDEMGNEQFEHCIKEFYVGYFISSSSQQTMCCEEYMIYSIIR